MSEALQQEAGEPSSRADSMLAELEELSGRPLRAMIEVSDRCNEVCVHCYQEQGEKGEMSTAEIKAVMDELAELGVLVLTISGGEATLRKDFLELCAHARSRGFALRLFTNGLTMTAELAHALAELAVHVVEISLYSHRAEAHDAITGVPGSFERTVAGIAHLVREGVDVHVKTPVMSVNEDELTEYSAFASSLGASFGFDPAALLPREARDREPERLSRSADAVRRVLTDPQLGGSGPAESPVESLREKALSSSLCGAGEYVLVEPNGVLRPCTMLHVDLGRAQDGIASARQQSPALDAMRKLTWADVHGCRDCDLRGDCQRCHAASLAAVGDALAPYPSACESAQAVYAARSGSWPRIEPRRDGDPRLGPFRRKPEEPHSFIAFDDLRTAEDDALAARIPWVRREGGALPSPGARVASGELVQLRRPGSKRARAMTIPKAKSRS